MSPRRFLRVALHLLLAVGLVLPGIAAPAQAVGHALATMSGHADAMSQSPCSGMTMPDTPHMPSGTQHGCDLAACLGAGCLPVMPHVAAFIPDADSLVTWKQPVPPSRLPDTLLRPPIA